MWRLREDSSLQKEQPVYAAQGKEEAGQAAAAEAAREAEQERRAQGRPGRVAPRILGLDSICIRGCTGGTRA